MTSSVSCCRGGTILKFGRRLGHVICKNRFTAKKIHKIQKIPEIRPLENSFRNFLNMEDVPGNQLEIQELQELREGGNTKTPSSYRSIFVTWNNYTDDDYERFLAWAKKQKTYIVGKEVGEQGTPHIQASIWFKHPKAQKSIKNLWPKIHFEHTKGTEQENRKYCSKDGLYETNIPIPLRDRLLALYKDTIWKPWQADIIQIVTVDPHPRTVHWFVDFNGNTGKSYLTKYLCLKYDAIICNGKTSDVFNQVCQWMQKNPETSPRLVILDCPRSSMDYINYQAIEKLKDGCFYSGKYEGGMCLYESPHVVCFANCSPDRSKMSADRWNIVVID